MMRQARDGFEAWQTAESMEKAGAEVISIAYDGQHQLIGALVRCAKFVVFARVPDDVKIYDVDKMIDSMIDSRSNMANG